MAQRARDPDALKNEVEATRDELARTIDAIAGKVSPRQVAARGMRRISGNASNAKDVATGRMRQLRSDDMLRALPTYGRDHGEPGETAEDVRTTTYLARTLRKDRLALAVGLGLVVVATVVVVRRRSGP